MNLGSISKAIAGAATGGILGVGTVMVTVPESVGMPWWGYIVTGVINAGIVFAGVYFAPRNTQ